MTYLSTRKQRIAGDDYIAGEPVPNAAIQAMKPRVVTAMLTMGRLEFVDGPAPVTKPEAEATPEPVYKGSGWWEWPNGMKARGPADKPPALTGA